MNDQTDDFYSEPPARPTLLGWLRFSERDRQEYEAGVAAYLRYVLKRDHEEAFLARLVDWHIAYDRALHSSKKCGDLVTKHQTHWW